MLRTTVLAAGGLLFVCTHVGGQQLSPAFHARGFTDINYLLTERDVPTGFRHGQLAGHMVATLSERVVFFGELTATATPTGYNVAVERSILRYDFSDAFKLSAGKYHTPVSYWNTAFHHGQWLQTTVARPEMVKFGSNFLPVHFVGLLAEGNVPAGPLGLGYTAGVGSGRQRNIAQGGDAGDVNHHRALNFGVFSRPTPLRGLQVGGAIYTDRVSPTPTTHFDERIVAGHFVLERESPEVLAEFARVTHEPNGAGGPSTSNDAYYVQFGYRLPGAARAFKPYARFERVDVNDQDALFAPLNLDYEAAIAGLRFDFASAAALKAEYRRERFTTSDRFASLFLQVSFTFPSIDHGTHH